jgi:hypothetical protein
MEFGVGDLLLRYDFLKILLSVVVSGIEYRYIK